MKFSDFKSTQFSWRTEADLTYGSSKLKWNLRGCSKASYRDVISVVTNSLPALVLPNSGINSLPRLSVYRRWIPSKHVWTPTCSPCSQNYPYNPIPPTTCLIHYKIRYCSLDQWNLFDLSQSRRGARAQNGIPTIFKISSFVWACASLHALSLVFWKLPPEQGLSA